MIDKVTRLLSSFVRKPATQAETPIKKFGTFGGVFTPNVLTILGVIMYLGLSWVVGNAGLVGAVVIILLAKSVTICTGLSADNKVPLAFIKEVSETVKSSCVFVIDSGYESALA